MNAVLHIRKTVLDVSQAGLADIAGTTQATVSRWENGELFPDLAQMRAIRAAVIARGLDWQDGWFFETPATPLDDPAAEKAA